MNYTPKIGKNLIEILTDGMYKNPLFMYREYIQNSADSINEAVEKELLENQRQGKILIKIQGESIFIEDNGTGVEFDNISRKLYDIAHSDKDSTKRMGFRGIGRLGGVAYCETLKFITSAKGEDKKTILTINCKKLREQITDPNISDDASEIIINNSYQKTESENCDKRYFIVHLENVSKDMLLDEEKVTKYLSEISPVPFSSAFSFRKKIIKKVEEYGEPLPEYEIFVNNNQLFKPYSDNIYSSKRAKNQIIDTLIDINIREVTIIDEVVAIFWYGLCKFSNQLSRATNPAGLRYKQWNIQIGDADTLKYLFPEARGNLYFVGEVYCISKSLKANSRRDSFNHSELLTSLENKLKEEFFILNKLYRNANEIKNMLKKKKEYKDSVEVFNKSLSKGFKDDKELSHHKALLNAKKETAIVQKSRIDDFINDKAEEKQILSSIYKEEIDNYSDESIKKIDELISQNQQEKLEITNGQTNLGLIIKRIEKIIHAEMPVSRAQKLVDKIKIELL
jgi:hypothetical protein